MLVYSSPALTAGLKDGCHYRTDCRSDLYQRRRVAISRLPWQKKKSCKMDGLFLSNYTRYTHAHFLYRFAILTVS